MRRLLAPAAVAIALVTVPMTMGVAHAAPPCTDPVSVNCDYCVDPNGVLAPPQPCMFGAPGFGWVDCTLWVQGQCIVG